MEGEGSEYRAWGELIPDALSLIFGKLTLQEILQVVPCVCNSWGRVASGPYCWQEIDIEEWSQRSTPEQIDRLVRMLVARSNGSLKKFAVTGIPDDALFSFITEHAASLQTLVLPQSKITDSIIEQVSSRLSNVTYLDISYCNKIGPKGIAAFGRSCKSLTTLQRRMHLLEVVGKVNYDEEAFAIASTMPKLRCLAVAYLPISPCGVHTLSMRGVHEILEQCSELEFLDVRGCWDVKLDEIMRKDKCAKLLVLGPRVVDDSYYDDSFSSGSSDYADESAYSWELMENELPVLEVGNNNDGELWRDGEPVHEGLDVRFYGRGFNQTLSGFIWPGMP